MNGSAPDLGRLLLQLDTLVWKIETDRPIPGVQYAQLSQAADSLAASLDEAGRAQLAQRVDRVISALQARRDQLSGKLRAVGLGRRAVGAYAGSAGRPQ